MLSVRRLRRRQLGVTLMEVLVTMAIVSVGMLGQAALVAQSHKVNSAAFLRSQATLLADDMFERMRLNRTLAYAGSFNYVDGVTALPTGSEANTMPGLEIVNWVGNVKQYMGSAAAPTIACDGSGNALITIVWQEVADGSMTGSGTATTFNLQSQI